MAETAVHFSVTTQIKPTIFEIIAQESLAATIDPAFKKLIEFLATTRPEYFNRILLYYDELYLLISGLIEYYYIKNYDATFSESFYGLKRVCTNALNDLPSLSTKKRYLSLACVVLLPYIFKKIESKSKILLDLKNENKNTYARFETFIYTLNIIKFAWKGYELIQLLAYVSGATNYHSTLLKFCKINLVYAPSNHLQSSWSWTDLFTNKIKISTALGSGLLRLFEVSAFFIQFFQSWSSDNYQFNIAALPNPPPPQIDGRAVKYYGKCPVCLQTWNVPTALQVSGYVYCYKCISTHLKKYSRCPVTQYPATTDDLVKLYYSICVISDSRIYMLRPYGAY
ncbi:peroxisome assembly protein 12 [Ctenocephalides felis]|uniref:peroxisome assembly protein 12 n=1 Tax=Ctenocephalides felis TaxID=7515 RepID=UPI000E6E27AD|nr:peroxisome assembly protein 12 [Ctenocephalides felis]